MHKHIYQGKRGWGSRNRERLVAILNRMIRVDLLEKVTCEQTLEGEVGVIHTDTR